METITVLNVNHALPRALALLRDTGRVVSPRGMTTREIDGPVATTYLNPREMVLFDPMRDANPFFHFFEALWILRGRGDVKFLASFLPRMADYSDNGLTFHAPYGFRLRFQFTCGDQIELAINKLKNDRDTRQCVLSIWDPAEDWKSSKDIPCNDTIMLKIRDGKLRMTVCNRSNDVIWGTYGANVVQFSTLLCYIAGRVGVDVGAYTQISDSFHVYEDNPFWNKWLERYGNGGTPPVVDNLYAFAEISDNVHATQAYLAPHELFSGAFDSDLHTFFDLWDKAQTDGELKNIWVYQYETDSFSEVVVPMFLTFSRWKEGHKTVALDCAQQIRALDWKSAVKAWMLRRQNAV